MSEILQKAENFVTHLMVNKLHPNYLYHNLKHTQRVAESAQEISDHYTLEKKEAEALLLATWFHDTGYIKGSTEHEKASCMIARDFLDNEGLSKSTIEKVEKLIMATQMHYEPETLPEEIIRDADASHLGQKSYFETTDFLRRELALLGLADYSAKEWREKNIAYFKEHHRFYTDYALEHWENGKQKNLKQLVKERKTEKEIAKKEAIKAKYKSESPDRGIQTLFRVTLKNHLTLSDIADTKANILLSVNAIIISVALSNLIPKLDNPSNGYLVWPTVIFILFSVVSMAMAVFATRPNVTSGTFSKEDVAQKKVNLLFFGNFHKMKLDEYEWAIQELVKDKDYIYSSLTKDLYFLGLVLNRKYKILRWTYTIFIVGIVVSVIAFGISFRYYA